MFYHDKKLQYRVRVDKPNPVFARMLQHAIGGIKGEIRVCLRYLFQAWESRGPVGDEPKLGTPDPRPEGADARRRRFAAEPGTSNAVKIPGWTDQKAGY